MDYQVGLVGVGKMGAALLSRLVIAGAKVRAFDIDERAMQAARDAGAETVASPAEAARGARFIHVFVYNDQDILDCTLGNDSVLSTADSGATVILHSTVLPETTRRVSAEAVKKDIRVVDAPITSTPIYVQAGDAVFLVGGDDRAVADIEPYLKQLGREVWHFGPLGSGHAAKLVKNLANAMERVLWMEALTMVKGAGIDPKRYAEMLKSVVRGSAISNWQKIIAIENSEITPTQPANNIYTKDVPCALTFVRSLGLRMPMAEETFAAAARFVAEDARRVTKAVE